MPNTPEAPKPTPEEQALQEEVTRLGLREEPEGQPPAEPAKPEAAPVAPTPPAPAAAAAPVAPPAPTLSEQELKELRDKAGWAERAQSVATSEKTRADALATDNERLRKALGVPAGPTQAKTPEQMMQDQQAHEWFDRTAAERLANLPEETLAKHPALVRRDNAIRYLNDRLDQALFLMRFPADQQATLQRSVLPILQQQRATIGYTRDYGELWEAYREAVKTQAQLVGIAVQAPAPPAPPTPQPGPTPAGPTIPPSLSGVRGGSEVPKQPIQLTVDEGRLFGMA